MPISIEQHLSTTTQKLLDRRIKFNLARKSSETLNSLKYEIINKPKKVENTENKRNIHSSFDTTLPIPLPRVTLFDSDLLDFETKVMNIGSGLINIGNTCYINSVLQCLLYTPLIANFLFSNKHSEKCINTL